MTPKAIVFDIDGTLAIPERGNAWFEITYRVGASLDEHRALYESVRAKQLSLDTAKRELIRLWTTHKPLTKTMMEEVFYEIPLRVGAEDILNYIHNKGYTACVISGSPSTYAEVIGKRLSVTHVYANDFFFNDAGELVDYEYDPEQDTKKLTQFMSFCSSNNLSPSECSVIGDGDNDVLLFRNAGAGYAITPLDGSELDIRLSRVATHTIHSLDELRDLI